MRQLGIVISWSLFQIMLTVVMIKGTVKILGFSPSKMVFENPANVIVPSIFFLIVTCGFVVLVQKIWPNLFKRSPWKSETKKSIYLIVFLLGLVPVTVSGLLFFSFMNGQLEWRPTNTNFPISIFSVFLFMIFTNACMEELAFRTTPIALVSKNLMIIAFLVPTVTFVAIHLLESHKEVQFIGAFQLIFVSLLFFVIAKNHGLFPATIVHVGTNFATLMTDGNWRNGAILKMQWTDTRIEEIGSCIGYIIAIIIYYFYWRFTLKRRRPFPSSGSLQP